jgi:hypothetical protein
MDSPILPVPMPITTKSVSVAYPNFDVASPTVPTIQPRKSDPRMREATGRLEASSWGVIVAVPCHFLVTAGFERKAQGEAGKKIRKKVVESPAKEESDVSRSGGGLSEDR